MSKYTTELRFIIESGAPVFDFKYPFYDENKRLQFQEHFIKHFYFREIGFETFGLFKWHLENKFNEILPFYNELFRSAMLQYDPLLNYDVKETYTKGNTETMFNDVSGTQQARENTSGSTSITEINTADSETTEKVNGTASEVVSGSTTQTSNKTIDNENTVERTNDADKTVNTENKGKTNKAHSDTPQGKISIETNTYVSDLDREDNEETVKTTDKEKTTGSEVQTGNTTETNENETFNDVTADNVTTNESESKTSSGYSTTSDGSNSRNSTGTATYENTATGNKNGEETFSRSMSGNIGVMTAPDLLERHLKIQRTLTTIENQFFEECNDLFMQLW